MQRNDSGWRRWSARLVILTGAVFVAGCETWTERMDLPSGYYIQHPPQAVTPPDPKEEKNNAPPAQALTPIVRSEFPADATVTGPNRAEPVGTRDAAPAASGELEEALKEHAEALASLRVAMRALEASQKRLEALAKKGVAVPPAAAAPEGRR